MSDMRNMLVDSATRLFADVCTKDVHARAEQGLWQADIWATLETAGLPGATLSETRGGAGADLGDALAVVREAGAASLPAPLAETMMAELMLSAAGLAPRAGPLTIGPVLSGDQAHLVTRGDEWEISGHLHRVPWARHAQAVVVVAQTDGLWATAAVDRCAITEQGSNFANEPRDDIRLDALRLPKDAVSIGGGNLSAEKVIALGALFRSAAMAGALTRVLSLTLSYALEREQFGQRIGKFQAIQHQIAMLASQVAAASAAADTVFDCAAQGSADFEIAAAKVRIGEAAGIAAGIAHQVHAAMGFTQEYPLHRSTRRLWSWRDEFGSESEWSAWIGGVVFRLGAQGLWPFLTSAEKAIPAAVKAAV